MSLGSILTAGEIESFQSGFRKIDPSSPSRSARSVPVPSTPTLTFVRSTRRLWRDERSSFGLTRVATSYLREPKEQLSNTSLRILLRKIRHFLGCQFSLKTLLSLSLPVNA